MSDEDKSPLEYLGILMTRLDEIEGVLKDARGAQDRIERRQQKIEERLSLVEAKSGLR
jgi:hypothetical protein